MDPERDPKLSELLKEWQLPGAPASLDALVLPPRQRWWRVLMTGSIRIPIPAVLVIAAILLLMAVAIVRRHPAEPQASTPINLADFQPVKSLSFRVIRGNNDSR